ncbi:hypothetical protein E2C01_012733 [Portunus trituberculatus]|uniref:Uncharacterized protein n=1 Tax=Portunus trituberculatus TaxID=210409 RepID=A0A5B7DEV9_PORTR|nr:hypothetical protein [Portunus trituberculatus]
MACNEAGSGGVQPLARAVSSLANHPRSIVAAARCQAATRTPALAAWHPAGATPPIMNSTASHHRGGHCSAVAGLRPSARYGRVARSCLNYQPVRPTPLPPSPLLVRCHWSRLTRMRTECSATKKDREHEITAYKKEERRTNKEKFSEP